MMQQHISNAPHQPFPPVAAQNPSDDSMPFSLDPFTAKQMAALQATSIAKAGNRSAPGGTSAPYFGGMSMNQPPSRPEPSPEQHGHAFGSLSDFQAPNQQSISQLNMNPANQGAMQQMMRQQQQKKRSFLSNVASLMLQRGVPLPPSLTGVPYPASYDPNMSPWNSLEVVELGVVRLAGKEVDLFKLWGYVSQAGGSAKATQQGSWMQIVHLLSLPEHVPQVHGQTSTAAILAQLYTSLMGPFEEIYRRQQQQRALLASRPQHAGNPQSRPGGPGGVPGALPGQGGALPGSTSSLAHLNMPIGQTVTSAQTLDGPLGMTGSSHQLLPQTTQLSSHHVAGLSSVTPDARGGSGLPSGPELLLATTPMAQRPSSGLGGHPFSSNQDTGGLELDNDAETRKRKMRESEDPDPKRVRVKTGGSDSSETRSSTGAVRSSAPPADSSNAGPAVNGAAVTHSQRQPFRRKIEYIPFAREVDTAGGRDLEAIQNEFFRAGRRPFKDINDWGRVDVEALTMSLRSRISTELSYGLTTFTLLTLMRGSHKDAGFPIVQCLDLLDEVLDVLEDVAFNSSEDEQDTAKEAPCPCATKTHRELVNALSEDGARTFAALELRQGSKDPSSGPRQRPADTVLSVMNILRNLSVTPENQPHLAKHDRLLPLLLRLCDLAQPNSDSLPTPASPVLSLSDLLTVRKDTVNLLFNCDEFVDLSVLHSKGTARTTRRLFELLSSYVTDSFEAVPPFTCVLQSGIPPTGHPPEPPYLADLALEVFTRLTQPDDARKIISQTIPHEWLWTVVEALTHRLPVSDHDFQVIMRVTWASYILKLVMMIYTIAFLAPPDLKPRFKTDRRLGLTKILLRMVKKIMLSSIPESRASFFLCVGRVIELLKLIDNGDDPFDTSQSTLPILTFGVGHGEHGEARVEKGMGLLSGYQEDIAWGLMMQREVDLQMFTELDSLVRLE